MIVGVDNPRTRIGVLPAGVKIVQVNVAVYEKPRLEGAHQPEKRLESPMAPVVPVSDAEGRGVGDHHIDVTPVDHPVPEEPGQDREDVQVHLELSVLIDAPVVPTASAETRDEQLTEPDDSTIDVDPSDSLRPPV